MIREIHNHRKMERHLQIFTAYSHQTLLFQQKVLMSCARDPVLPFQQILIDLNYVAI